MSIFISYAKEDISVARKIYVDLKSLDFQVWLDEEDLLPGQNWKQAINQAVEESSHIILLLSHKSVSKTGYIQKEIKLALDLLERQAGGSSRIIPVRLDACQPTDNRLLDIQWVDLFPDYKKGFGKILKVLKPGEEVSLLSKAFDDHSLLLEGKEFEKLDSRTAFFNKAIDLLTLNPRAIRIMLVGPLIFHPDWVFAVRNDVESRPSFATELAKNIFDNLHVDRDVRIMFNNTERYYQIVQKYVDPSQLERFKIDVVSKIDELIIKDVHQTIGFSCINPGIFQVVFVTEHACLETSRETVTTPTQAGIIIREPSYIQRQITKFDRIYDSGYRGRQKEISALKDFVNSA